MHVVYNINTMWYNIYFISYNTHNVIDITLWREKFSRFGLTNMPKPRTCTSARWMMRLLDTTYRESLKTPLLLGKIHVLSGCVPNRTHNMCDRMSIQARLRRSNHVYTHTMCKGLASKSDDVALGQEWTYHEEQRRMGVSRTTFTRIHRDALPTVKRRERWKKGETHSISHHTH